MSQSSVRCGVVSGVTGVFQQMLGVTDAVETKNFQPVVVGDLDESTAFSALEIARPLAQLAHFLSHYRHGRHGGEPSYPFAAAAANLVEKLESSPLTAEAFQRDGEKWFEEVESVLKQMEQDIATRLWGMGTDFTEIYVLAASLRRAVELAEETWKPETEFGFTTFLLPVSGKKRQVDEATAAIAKVVGSYRAQADPSDEQMSDPATRSTDFLGIVVNQRRIRACMPDIRLAIYGALNMAVSLAFGAKEQAPRANTAKLSGALELILLGIKPIPQLNKVFDDLSEILSEVILDPRNLRERATFLNLALPNLKGDLSVDGVKVTQSSRTAVELSIDRAMAELQLLPMEDTARIIAVPIGGISSDRQKMVDRLEQVIESLRQSKSESTRAARSASGNGKPRSGSPIEDVAAAAASAN